MSILNKLSSAKKALETKGKDVLTKTKNTFTKTKNMLTKGDTEDFVEFTGDDERAIAELAKGLENLKVYGSGYGEIGASMANNQGGKTPSFSADDDAKFYTKFYICQGVKSDRIDEKFKFHVINKTKNKGGILGGFKIWSTYVYSKLKSIVSKSSSEIAKIEKLRDSNRKLHWEKFYEIAIKSYKELGKVFDPDSGFNKKITGNKNSRMSAKDVIDKLEELTEQMNEKVKFLSEAKEKLKNLEFNSESFDRSIDYAVEQFCHHLNTFKSRAISQGIVSGVVPTNGERYKDPTAIIKDYKSSTVYRGPKSEQIHEQFKFYVIDGTKGEVNVLDGFKTWSDCIYSELKAIASYADSSIADMEKSSFDPKSNWLKFYQIEISALYALESIFYLNLPFTKKFLNNPKLGKERAETLSLTLKNLQESIESKVSDYKECQKALEKIKEVSENTITKDDIARAVDKLAGRLDKFRDYAMSPKGSISGATSKKSLESNKDYFKNFYVYQGRKYKQIDQIFKSCVMKDMKDKGDGLYELKTWVEGTYVRLKSMTFKASHRIKEIEKIHDPKKHCGEFFKTEIAAYEELKKYLDLNQSFNKEFIESERVKPFNKKIIDSLNKFQKQIDDSIKQRKDDQQELEKIDFNSPD